MSKFMRDRLKLSIAAASIAVLMGSPAAAQDVDENVYADWILEGSGGAYTGTMTLPDDFPATTFTSDARAASTLNSGTSTWIPEGTPFGDIYGSSRGRPYPNLRPVADSPGSPSTTTYTFASPTLVEQNWGFALGDIDADQIEISATGTDGNPVPIDDLGFQGVFNYCDASPRSAACSGEGEPYHLPTWSPGTFSGSLVGDGDDKTGSTGWFQPTVPLSTLTFKFTQISGFPVYQTWFAAHPIVHVPDPDPTPTSETPADPTAKPVGGDSDSSDSDADAGTGTSEPTHGAPALTATGTNVLIPLAIGSLSVAAGLAALAIRRRREAARS